MRRRGSQDGRLSLTEIVEKVRREFSFQLIDGVDSIVETSKAVRNDSWVTSFLDARCAYYIHQNGQDFLEWKTHKVPSTSCPYVVFVFSIGMGFGSPLPQPSGQFDLYINGEHSLSFRVTKEDELWKREGVSLYFWKKRIFVAAPYASLCMDEHIKEESTACYGLAFLKIPREKIRQEKKNFLKIEPKNRQVSSRWFKLDVSKWANPIFKSHISSGLVVISKQSCIRNKMNGYLVGFGDIHCHTGVGNTKNKPCGLGTIDENYIYARDVARLDFCSITDHDWQLTSSDWHLRMEKAEEYNKDDVFVTIPGFEWTSAKYGHRNVYYADLKGDLLKSHPHDEVNAVDNLSESPKELWERLDKVETPAITVPHHPSISYFPVDWSYKHEKYERLVEIYSCWGNSEYHGAPFSGTASDRDPTFSVCEALKQRNYLGIIASSDSHDGHPGNAQWSFRQPHLHPWLGSGRVAVLVKRLTRGEIFNALYARRCYATTGTRILLNFQINGHAMGSEVTLASPEEKRTIVIRVKGTCAIENVCLIKNGSILHTWCPTDRHKEITCTYEDYTAVEQWAFYYVRIIQLDREMAWSSPIWVKY